MAEAIVTFVAERLGALLLEKITFLRGIRGQLEYLKEELVSIKEFLKTADSIHNQDPGIRVWVAKVRDIAYDVDDIIDVFLLKVATKEGEGSNNVLMRCARIPKKLFNFNNIGKELDSIVAKIKEISDRRKRYDGITSMVQKEGTTSSPSSEMLLRRVYLHTEDKDDDTVGLEDQTNTMVAELQKDEDRRCVVSIHGMGGLGKTTLAKKVYNHRDIKNHFDCYAWTTISQTLNTKTALQEILKKVSTTTYEDMSKMNEEELFGKIYKLLQTNRYLVVLDDIWNKEDWDALKPAFPNNKGSKVMFTTRNLEVAEHADRRSFHLALRSLTDDEAWELLCRKAFPYNLNDSSWSLSSDFEECGRNMVKKCGGFPLQVIVLGGILESKGTTDEWKVVSEQIGIHTSHSQGDRVISILSLSYTELPYNMKPLFLYLGLFPEDFLIPVKVLVRMWMAESLIRQEKEGETIEEVGTRYLDELIHRSMVQIGKKGMGGKKIRTCRLHDEMRKLCIMIGREENFLEEINVNGGSFSSSCSVRTSNKLRRCAIYIEEPYEQDVFPKQLTQSLRAAIFIQRDLPFSIINFKDFKILKVLNLEGYFHFGNEVVRLLRKLTNLRYLCITGYGTEILVKYFKNLVCLQTLDLRLRHISMDGKEIFNTMHQLRHLYGYEIKLSTINKMTNLQTLRDVRAGPWMTDLVYLTNLEKLGILGLDEETSRLLTMVIGGDGLGKLRSLYLDAYVFDEGFLLDLLEALSGKRHLQKLKLVGKISKLPSQFPSNLIKLTLSQTHSSEDLMPTLEKLQHLLVLNLSYAYNGKQMVCSAKGFPKLEHLQIFSLHQLEEWTVEKGAMPCLTSCSIERFSNLKMVPHGFKFLTMLQDLKIVDMPNSFEERVKQGGEDWETVQHIPSITIRPYIENSESSVQVFSLRFKKWR